MNNLSQESLTISSEQLLQVVSYLRSCGVSKESADDFLSFFQTYAQLRERVEVQEKIVAAWVEKPRCWGTKSWRNQTYLYINHSPPMQRKLGDCPCHGWSNNPSKRHYVYVGKDVVAQDEAVITLKNWQHWEKQERILSDLNSKLSSLDWGMSSLFDKAKTQGRLL